MTAHEPARDDTPASALPAADPGWADAEALLAGAPSEAAERRLRRFRRTRLLVVGGSVVVVGGLAVAIGVLVADDVSEAPDVPTWQAVAGRAHRSLDGRGWVLAALAEAVLLGVAGFRWVGGFVAAPGFAAPTHEGTLAGVWALDLGAAILCLVVPAVLVRMTGVRRWWLAGAVPAAGAIATAVAISAGW